jgi:hypothetical protein
VGREQMGKKGSKKTGPERTPGSAEFNNILLRTGTDRQYQTKKEKKKKKIIKFFSGFVCIAHEKPLWANLKNISRGDKCLKMTA